MDALDIVERNNIFEFEAFIGLMKDAGKLYANCSYVQKRKIASIVCSNIILTKEKKLNLAVKPLLSNLFTKNGG
jgi:hypothetical protein